MISLMLWGYRFTSWTKQDIQYWLNKYSRHTWPIAKK